MPTKSESFIVETNFGQAPLCKKRAFSNEKIEFVWDTVLDEIVGNGMVSAINMRNVKTSKSEQMDTDGVFIYVGHYPNSKFLEGQLAMDEQGYVIADEKMRTSIPGVFAAGEIQDSYFRQIATSVGQGCAAAMQCEKWLSERE